LLRQQKKKAHVEGVRVALPTEMYDVYSYQLLNSQSLFYEVEAVFLNPFWCESPHRGYKYTSIWYSISHICHL